MSGSGGFFKYRCKYFYTHDCPNWVFVNYAPCAQCCAAGRDDPDGDHALPPRPGFDIAVPVFRDGVLHYTHTHVAVHVVPGAPFVSWRFADSSSTSSLGGHAQPQLTPQHLPYGSIDDAVHTDHHHHHPLLHDDDDDNLPHAQHRPRPHPPPALPHPQLPRHQQPQPLLLHGQDDYDVLPPPPPYAASFGGYAGLRY